MAWTYHQSTGKFFHDGKYAGRGHAGKGKWQNMPSAQNMRGEGPLPRGTYAVARNFMHDPAAGKHSLRLTPDPGNQMFGRSHFLIHGENPARPGESSDGCIVASFSLRLQILRSGDRTLKVVR